MGKDLKGKELGKGITQRKDGRYQARFTDRFGKRRCVYGVTLKEVKNALMSEVVDDYSKNNVVEPNMTFGQWFEKWMRVYKEPVLKTSTVRRYKSEYNCRIKPVFENLPLSSINQLKVTEFFNTIGKELRIGSVITYRELLYEIFESAVNNDLCVKNPVKGVKLSGIDKKNMEALSPQEQHDFFAAATDNFYYNMFVVAINTGLRSGELRALTVDDIDLDNNIITVNKSLVFFTKKPEFDTEVGFKIVTPKTKASIRTVPINAICREALINQLTIHNSLRPAKYDKSFGELLFTTHLNTPIHSKTYTKGIYAVVNKINNTRIKEGLSMMRKFNSHIFRHTFATRCFEAGISPKTVQAYLGHTSIAITMNIYTQVQENKKTNDMQLLENMMNSINS